MSRIVFRSCVGLVLLVLFFVASCESPSTTARQSLDAASVAQEIAGGVGQVQKTSGNGTTGPVFVFEEVHTNRVGQLQIATMLVRLHDRHQVKTIALEGSIWSGKPLQGDWYQSVDPGKAQGEKEDLAVRMVAEGEISASELLAILFPDVHVYGIEDASQYQQGLDVKGSPEIEYLLAIAERSITPEAAQRVERLLRQKKEKQALDYMLNADPWVKDQYETFKNASMISAEQMTDRLHGLEAKATEVGAQIQPQEQQDMENEIHFFETASERSNTMVHNTIELAGGSPGAPVAMIVGAAHADKVVELLGRQNASYALIRPVDLDSKFGSMSVEEYDRKIKGEWARNTRGTLGYVLNSHKKPPPVIERTTGQSYASMQLASLLLAKAAYAGGPFPDGVWPEVSSLPGLRVDRDSITRAGHDVIFRAWLKQDDGSEKEVWARVGRAALGNGNQPDNTLEAKLIGAAEELKAEGGGGDQGNGGGSKGGGNGDDKPPGESGGHDEEGPGDTRKHGAIISRIGMDTMVFYGSKREDVMAIGKIGI